MSSIKIKNEEAEILAEKEKKEQQVKAQKCLDRLLGVSLKFSSFIKKKLKDVTATDKENAADNSSLTKNLKLKNYTSVSQRNVLDQMKYFSGGKLHPYQIDGVTWLSILFENHVNGILADEMGLGKTIQVIALICHLYERNIPGPYLIIVPLSTLPNWVSEFEKFAPKIPVYTFRGNISEREQQYRKIKHGIFSLDGKRVNPVILTTYQMPLVARKYFESMEWQYVILDEGHKIKNYKGSTARVLRMIPSKNRLLLTGTPLQNDLLELWSLLNYLLPKLFSDMESFTSLLFKEDMENDETILEKEVSTNLVTKIHRVLETFVLRRLKSDVNMDIVPKKEVLVYCPITEKQETMYTHILDKNIQNLSKNPNFPQEIDIDLPRSKRMCRQNRTYYVPTLRDYENSYDQIYKSAVETQPPNETEKKTHVFRITTDVCSVMLKKACSHPYLIEFPLDPNFEEKEFLIDENIVNTSGKMMVLDAMLKKLKIKGHKVLIFSTLCMMLDIIEEYLIMRKYKYSRLDGSYAFEKRKTEIEQFNSDPSVFIFLLSTRAGGLGLNLTAADTVIFYDRDWNPQADIQAQARCHRLGQTKPVAIYTLVTKNTVDERIISVGDAKRKLEKILIKNGNSLSDAANAHYNTEQGLLELKKILADNSNRIKIHSNGEVYSNQELEQILDRRDLYKQMKEGKLEVKSSKVNPEFIKPLNTQKEE